jgi:TPR repeat protein
MWFLKAAEHGDALAQNNLGFQYSRGLGVGRDDRTAMHWFEKAAAQGLPDAELNLGLMYEAGEDGIRNPERAMKFLQLAAASGSEKAREALRHTGESPISKKETGSGEPLP